MMRAMSNDEMTRNLKVALWDWLVLFTISCYARMKGRLDTCCAMPSR